jgi:ABC-2 type transport system ATP-binding protein
MKWAVEARSLAKTLDGRPVLRDVTMTVARGTIHAVAGANGAGKTTLLRVLTGLYDPTAGECRVLGERMHIGATGLRQRVHLVAADLTLPRGFTVAEYARYASLLYERWDAERWRRLRDALELPERRPLRHLSYGMQMQLRLAVALSARPELLLLDEPTVGLDPVVRRQFLQLLLDEAVTSGVTVVVASHELDELERMADHLTVLYRGRVVVSGPLEELKQSLVRLTVRGIRELPASLQEHPGVWTWASMGVGVSVIVRAEAAQDVAAALRAAGAAHIAEGTDIPLDELFRLWMEREGYRRDSVVFA